MDKIDWIRKLTSRKFWVAIAAFVTGLLIYFGKSQEDVRQIEGLIMAGATVLAYILGEGLADAAGAHGGDTYIEEYHVIPEEEEKPDQVN